MQAVVGASAAPLGVPGVPVAPQGPVGQGLQGPAVPTEALEDLGRRILAQESQGVHLPRRAREGGNLEVTNEWPCWHHRKPPRSWEQVGGVLLSPTPPSTKDCQTLSPLQFSVPDGR